ncbi:MAG: hypothetical protein EZS28_049825 [Streblomastix strix]|uniref:Uncharacterized protein n=1 Tax=Streblomastix strix TaxID=222440 RepID=A0A5J4T8V6_9EUKA|nr:MAG: hypothetical protein EZS28_049825 [Streblomastix strix]
MHIASKDQLQGLMDKLVQGYKLSLLATGDAQRVREQLVGGIQTRSEKAIAALFRTVTTHIKAKDTQIKER